ncbi:hypothetical protein PCE1_001381 [Barthelona sp. PCE]
MQDISALRGFSEFDTIKKQVDVLFDADDIDSFLKCFYELLEMFVLPTEALKEYFALQTELDSIEFLPFKTTLDRWARENALKSEISVQRGRAVEKEDIPTVLVNYIARTLIEMNRPADFLVPLILTGAMSWKSVKDFVEKQVNDDQFLFVLTTLKHIADIPFSFILSSGFMFARQKVPFYKEAQKFSPRYSSVLEHLRILSERFPSLLNLNPQIQNALHMAKAAEMEDDEILDTKQVPFIYSVSLEVNGNSDIVSFFRLFEPGQVRYAFNVLVETLLEVLEHNLKGDSILFMLNSLIDAHMFVFLNNPELSTSLRDLNDHLSQYVAASKSIPGVLSLIMERLDVSLNVNTSKTKDNCIEF